MTNITTKKTNTYIENKLKNMNTKENEFAKSLKTLLIDFNVIPYIIGFTIALSFQNLLNKMSSYIIQKIFKIKNPLLDAFIELILILIFVYIFVYYIYYHYLVSEDIEKEKIVKQALTEKKIDKAKKEIDEDKQTKKIIDKDIELKNNKIIEEYFMRY